MTVRATVTSKKASLVSVDVGDVKPTTVLHTASGDTDALAAINLCRKLVAEGWDPGARISMPPLTIKYLGQAL